MGRAWCQRDGRRHERLARIAALQGGDAGKPLVARAIALTPGAPIDPQAVGLTRRLLYDSGAYRGVEIELEPVADAAPSGTAASEARRSSWTRESDCSSVPLQLPLRLRVHRRRGGARCARSRLRLRCGLRAPEPVRRVPTPASRPGSGAISRSAASSRRQPLLRRAAAVDGVPRAQPPGDQREGEAPIVATVTDLSAEQSYSIRRRVELRYGYTLDAITR